MSSGPPDERQPQTPITFTMPYTADVRDSCMFLEPSHQNIQDDTLQGPTLVAPLAAFPPSGPSPFMLSYMGGFANPLQCINQERIIMNGVSKILENEDAEDDKKPDKEHKKRAKNWTRQETLKLIRLRIELEPQFCRAGRKSDLWDHIALSLQQDQFNRDGQQCRDKWEKLMSGYKEVRDGLKEREENPFFEDLHPLLSRKSSRRDKDSIPSQHETGRISTSQQSHSETKGVGKETIPMQIDGDSDESIDVMEDESSLKRKRNSKYVAVVNVKTVQTLLETLISRQQMIFKDFLDTLEQKEQKWEQIRYEREERWRAEEQSQSRAFNNAMILLTQKLVDDRFGGAAATIQNVDDPLVHQGPLKRSKNWKRAEVLQLIKLRGEMDAKFSKSSRRAALWDELSDFMTAGGIKRDAKQCKEKWDKLMAEYKDVIDGKREQNDSPYFQELMPIIGNKVGEAT